MVDNGPLEGLFFLLINRGYQSASGSAGQGDTGSALQGCSTSCVTRDNAIDRRVVEEERRLEFRAELFAQPTLQLRGAKGIDACFHQRSVC